VIIQTYYIQTGAKNAMYTLRCHRNSTTLNLGPFAPDFYLFNLAADEETAEYKATLFFNAMRDRLGPDTENWCMVLDCHAGGRFERRGKLSVRDTQNILKIEAGFVPFGKNAGKRIEDCDMGWILWLSDKAGTFETVPMNALAMAAQGIAFQKGYIGIREEKRAQQAVIDAQSEHIGKPKERRDFEGVLETAFANRDRGFTVNRVRIGNNLVVYIGDKPMGEVGAPIKFRATIKAHGEFKGVKSTIVNRPTYGKEE
jgi:hypothetical protein